MIKLQRRRTSAHVPKRFQQPKLQEAAAALATLYYEAQVAGKFTFDSKAWKPAKGALKIDTGGKCAYCETSTEVVAHGDVEHFRPKSIYWWLAFVFDNYLFSCQICNQTYKGDRFPKAGALLAAPVMPPAPPTGPALQTLLASLVIDATALSDAQVEALWSVEDADLPHPYHEDPERLFVYEADDANREIWLRSAGGVRADRALAAVETVLGLNREELRRVRYAEYRPLVIINASLPQLTPSLRRDAIAELRIQQGRTQPFAGMKRFFARAWGLPGPF